MTHDRLDSVTRRRSRHPVLAAVTVVLAAVLVAACGASGPSPSASASAPSATASATRHVRRAGRVVDARRERPERVG